MDSLEPERAAKGLSINVAAVTRLEILASPANSALLYCLAESSTAQRPESISPRVVERLHEEHEGSQHDLPLKRNLLATDLDIVGKLGACQQSTNRMKDPDSGSGRTPRGRHSSLFNLEGEHMQRKRRSNDSVIREDRLTWPCDRNHG